jgi:hypothetical protein
MNERLAPRSKSEDRTVRVAEDFDEEKERQKKKYFSFL